MNQTCRFLEVVIVFIILMLDLFFLSQDDMEVPSTDVEGVWAPDIEQSFPRDSSHLSVKKKVLNM